ncbi:MAG: L-threonylcarbamoyladenylate synthase [Patescibacteria group bacterium]
MARYPRSAVRVLRAGGMCVIPTDTLYGLVARAFSKQAVARIYALKKRSKKKPLIILISSARDLAQFGIQADTQTHRALSKLWPGKVSVIVPCARAQFQYLHRGTETLAFRVPKSKLLRTLLHATGPLVAPSANPEGEPPARTVREARRYFGDEVDCYVSGGRKAGKPSTLVVLRDGWVTILRKGIVEKSIVLAMEKGYNRKR